MENPNIYKQKESISTRKLGSDLMLYDKEADKVHILNETGALVWELLDGKLNIADIEKIFIQKFPGTKHEDISADINEIIKKLLSEKLVTSSDSQSA